MHSFFADNIEKKVAALEKNSTMRIIQDGFGGQDSVNARNILG